MANSNRTRTATKADARTRLRAARAYLDVGELVLEETADGAKLKTTFLKLIDIKDEAHYGLSFVSQRKARDAVRWAQLLVDRALEELER
ncbi:hypothetical protein [Nocardioides dilutus]